MKINQKEAILYILTAMYYTNLGDWNRNKKPGVNAPSLEKEMSIKEWLKEQGLLEE